MLITVDEVNEILQTSGKDDAIQSIIPLAVENAMAYTKNYFHIPGQYVEGYVISFDASLKKITNENADFIFEGEFANRFQPGLMIHVQNSIFNDGLYTIASVTASELIVSAEDTLYDEAYGSLIRIDLVKVPKGFKLALARFIGSLLEGVKQNLQSESIGDYSYSRKADTEMLSGFFSGYRKIKVV